MQERFGKPVAYALLAFAAVVCMSILLTAGCRAWKNRLDGEGADAVRVEQVRHQATTADAPKRSAEARADEAF